MANGNFKTAIGLAVGTESPSDSLFRGIQQGQQISQPFVQARQREKELELKRAQQEIEQVKAANAAAREDMNLLLEISEVDDSKLRKELFKAYWGETEKAVGGKIDPTTKSFVQNLDPPRMKSLMNALGQEDPLEFFGALKDNKFFETLELARRNGFRLTQESSQQLTEIQTKAAQGQDISQQVSQFQPEFEQAPEEAKDEKALKPKETEEVVIREQVQDIIKEINELVSFGLIAVEDRPEAIDKELQRQGLTKERLKKAGVLQDIKQSKTQQPPQQQAPDPELLDIATQRNINRMRQTGLSDERIKQLIKEDIRMDESMKERALNMLEQKEPKRKKKKSRKEPRVIDVPELTRKGLRTLGEILSEEQLDKDVFRNF